MSGYTGLPFFNLGFSQTDAPFETAPTFTALMGASKNDDAANYVESFTLTRGRQTEDDQAQTGTLTVQLRDTDARFDSKNAAGPYYPNLGPYKTVSLVALLGSPTPVTYPLFYGWTDPQNCWLRDENDPGSALVTLQANDGFDVLNSARIYTIPVGTLLKAGYQPPPGSDFPQELTGTRIAHVLGYADGVGIGHFHHGMLPSWPSSWQLLDPGNANMVALAQANTTGSTALQLIRDAELTEPGFFFFNGSGIAVFKDRHSRPTSTSSATFCDKANYSTGRVLYDSVTTRRTTLLNDIRVTAAGGSAVQEASDGSAYNQFVNLAKDFNTQHVSDADALAYAQWVLSLKETSFETLESLTLVPGTDDATWTQILSRELNDRITVVRTTPGGTSQSHDYFIEQISLSFGPGVDCRCTWRLSPADQFAYWLAGTAGYSEAGTTTRAGY